MDLPLYARVVWRFRLIVLAGLVLAALLAVLSIGRVGLRHGVSISLAKEQWGATSTLLVTQPGYPLGRAVADTYVQIPGTNGQAVPKYSDPSRFGQTALIYARLATSDGVRKLMAKGGPINGGISATTQTAAVSSAILLPTFDITAIAPSSEAATALARRATRAVIDYNTQQQVANGIARDNRVELRVLNQAAGAAVVKGRPLARGGVVFVAVMLLVLALVFVLENVRPRLRMVPVTPLHVTPESDSVASER